MEPKYEKIIQGLNARLQELSQGIRKSLRILVLDDDPLANSVLQELMGAEGYEVFLATTGEEGWRILQTIPVHLVILDQDLPGMSGIEFMEWVRRANQETDVIVITGYADLDSICRALDLGAYDYLPKPFDLRDLSFKVRSVLRNQVRQQLGQKVVEELKRVSGEFIEKGKISEQESQALIAEFTGKLNKSGSRVQNRILFSPFGRDLTLETASLLKNSGYQVTTVGSPAEVSPALRREECNLVILEGDTSQGSLGDMAAEIKAIRPDTEVLVSSGAVSLDSVLQVLRRGVSDYLHRTSANFELLERKVRKLMERQDEKLRYHHLIKELNNFLQLLIRTVEETARREPVFLEISHDDKYVQEMMAIYEDHEPEAAGNAGKNPKAEEEKTFSSAKVGTDMNWTPAAPAPRGCRRILVVDNEETVLAKMQELLGRFKYEIFLARSGEEALQALKNGRFCLLIAGRNLPGISGLDLMRKSRELDEEIELMMITGYAFMESALTAMDLGVSSYLIKPFTDLQQVMNQVRKALNQYEERVGHKRKLLELMEVHNQRTNPIDTRSGGPGR